MRAADYTQSLEILVEQAKSIYHTRLSTMTNIYTKAAQIMAGNGIVLAILGLNGLTDSGFSQYALHLCLLLTILSIVLCCVALFSRGGLPILDLEGARQNLDIVKTKREYLALLLGTYQKHIAILNKKYANKDKLNLVALLLMALAFFVIIGSVSTSRTEEHVHDSQTTAQTSF